MINPELYIIDFFRKRTFDIFTNPINYLSIHLYIKSVFNVNPFNVILSTTREQCNRCRNRLYRVTRWRIHPFHAPRESNQRPVSTMVSQHPRNSAQSAPLRTRDFETEPPANSFKNSAGRPESSQFNSRTPFQQVEQIQERKKKMNLNASFVLLLLGLALSQAVPAAKMEKSLEKEDLKIEEGGEDQDRSKKSIVCLDSASLLPQQQAYSIQAAPQPPVQTFNIQPVPQRIQTLNIQAVPQPVQTLNIQPVPSPIQTLSVIQPPIQPQASLKVVQPPQPPCPPAQTNVNIIQPPKEEKAVKPVVETVIEKEKIVKPEPKPEKMIVTKVEKEVVPMVPVFEEHMVVVPQKPVMMVAEQEPMTTFVKVPHCHHCQQSVMQCSCKQQGVPALGSTVMVEPSIRVMGMKERSMGRHVMTPSHHHYRGLERVS